LVFRFGAGIARRLAGLRQQFVHLTLEVEDACLVAQSDGVPATSRFLVFGFRLSLEFWYVW
jgi:hypothetical protein